MKGIIYQLKNIRRDKLCIISFLLPVIVGLAINLLTGVSLSATGETSFGVAAYDLADEMTDWLEQHGSITVYETTADLHGAVIDPATQLIGVMRNGDTIKAVLAGDELQVYKTIGDTLSRLFEERKTMAATDIEVHPTQNNDDFLKSLLIVITMVTAMFMGCTFNAMSIIGEKEDGISFINEILPMSQWEYVLQKIILGLSGSIISTIATMLVCVRVGALQLIPLLLLIVLSAFISALTGLFIGKFSSGLMIGIVYIKMFMILFIAPPILFYLLFPADSIAKTLSYILPSSATFYGIMDLLSGQSQNIGIYLVVLLVHSIGWISIYLLVGYRKGKK